MTLGEGVSFTSVVKIGRSIGDEIVATAAEYRAGLIILGYKGDEDALENSIIHHVVTRQPCDVAVVKAYGSQAGPFQKVLLPLGGKEVHDRLKSRLVHSLAGREGSVITFMTVVSPSDGVGAERRAYDALARASDLYGVDAETVVAIGDNVADLVVEEARNHDLVILGMRGEPLLRTFFFGALAHQIATRVECPSVLTKVAVGRKDDSGEERCPSPHVLRTPRRRSPER